MRDLWNRLSGGRAVTQPSSLLDPEVMSDPYPFYRWLRAEAPVFWDEKLRVWVISRYDDVVALGNDRRVSGVPPEDPQRPARQRLLKTLSGNLVMFNDPPAHTRLRQLMERAFWPLIDRVRDRVEQVTIGLLDAVQPTCRMEVMRDLAIPLPLTVQSEFIGLPLADSQQVTRWQAELAGFVFMTGFIPSTEEGDQQALQSLESLTAYLRPLLEERRREPKDDLLTALVRVGQDSDGLTPDEVLISALVLTMGSFLSITVALANCILGLARHPDQLQKLQEDSSRLDPAVEELLRYESQVQFSPRRAAQDFEFHGQRVGKDQAVIVGLGSSNRDETRFPDPDRLDITRPSNQHLAFGYGPHACIAQRLARLHIRGALRVLAGRVKTLQPEVDSLVWNGAPMFRSFESLPLSFTS
jgi:pimeloyl-[acyl-carrier protein] synthase